MGILVSIAVSTWLPNGHYRDPQFLDPYAGRQSARVNLNKIIYYGWTERAEED